MGGTANENLSILLTTLQHDYPNVAEQDIINTIQMHGNDASRCRQIVAECSKHGGVFCASTTTSRHKDSKHASTSSLKDSIGKSVKKNIQKLIASGDKRMTKIARRSHDPPLFVPVNSSSSIDHLQSPSTPSTSSSPSSPTPTPRNINTRRITGSDHNLQHSNSSDVPSSVDSEYLSTPSTTRSFTPIAPIAQPLLIDVRDHEPTAGRGYDASMLALAHLDRRYSPTLNSQSSALAHMRTAVDAKIVTLKDLEKDVEELGKFVDIQLRERAVSDRVTISDLEALKNENSELEQKIAEIRQQLDLPPPLPPKPTNRQALLLQPLQWNCQRCTALNHLELFRCELCHLPKIEQPSSNQSSPMSGVLRLTNVENAEWVHVSNVGTTFIDDR